MVQSVCTSAPREEERAASHERGVRGYARMYSRSQNLFPVRHWRIDRITVRHTPSRTHIRRPRSRTAMNFQTDQDANCSTRDALYIWKIEDGEQVESLIR